MKHFIADTQLSELSDKERKSFQMEDISYDESVNSEDKDEEACSQLHTYASAQPPSIAEPPLLMKTNDSPISSPNLF